MALDAIRYPEFPRVPFGVPIGKGWITLFYNPQDDTTYGAQAQELPYVQQADAFRTLTWAEFDVERKADRLLLGRVTRIAGRVGTRPDSDVVVWEVAPNLVGLAVEVGVDDSITPILYNAVNDTINAFGAAALFEPIPADYWRPNAPPIALNTQTEANDYFGRLMAGLAVNPSAPKAPTNGVVNDTLKEFTFIVNPLFPSYTQYKESGRPGATAPAYLSAATAYQVGNVVHVTGLAGAAKSSLGYYVAGSGNRPDGAVLVNNDAFTGAATPTGTKATAPSFGVIDDTNNTVPVTSLYSFSEVRWGIEGQGPQALPSNSLCSPGNIAGRLFAYVMADAAANRLQSDTVYSTAFTSAAANNNAPTATISVVGGATTATTGQAIVLLLSGYDTDGQVNKVEALDNGVKIGEISGSSGSLQTPALTAGSHNFTARAIDDKSAQGLSTAVVVTVSDAVPKGYQATYTDTIPANA